MDSRSTAISADVPATNGLLHVVNTVLLPSGMAPKIGDKTKAVISRWVCQGFVYPDKNLLELVTSESVLIGCLLYWHLMPSDARYSKVQLFQFSQQP